MPMARFDDLPRDVVERVVTHLGVMNRARAAPVSRTMRDAVRTAPFPRACILSLGGAIEYGHDKPKRRHPKAPPESHPQYKIVTRLPLKPGYGTKEAIFAALQRLRDRPRLPSVAVSSDGLRAYAEKLSHAAGGVSLLCPNSAHTTAVNADLYAVYDWALRRQVASTPWFRTMYDDVIAVLRRMRTLDGVYIAAYMLGAIR